MQFNVINYIGLGIVAVMLLPNIIYAFRFRDAENICTYKALNILEQVGRYASMALMFLPLLVREFRFPSNNGIAAYIIVNAVLLGLYLFFWMLFFKKQTMFRSMILAVIPTLIFLLSGLMLRHPLLVVSAVIFGIAHITITYINSKE